MLGDDGALGILLLDPGLGHQHVADFVHDLLQVFARGLLAVDLPVPFLLPENLKPNF